jgi:hypothetical protein
MTAFALYIVALTIAVGLGSFRQLEKQAEGIRKIGNGIFVAASVVLLIFVVVYAAHAIVTLFL